MIARAADDSAKEEEAPLQQRAARSSEKPPPVPPDFAAELRASRGEGHPVPAAALAFFESRFGADFGAVRLHDGVRASALSRSIGARAFTRGSHIYFAPGALDTGSSSGLGLLAHELTHVVQQGHAPARPGAAGAPVAAAGAGNLSRSVQRREEAEPESGDEPTEEQKAAARAAAARAAKLAAQAASTGKAEIAKSKTEQAKETRKKEAAREDAQTAAGAANQAKKSEKQKRKKRPAGREMKVEPPTPQAGAAGPAGPARAPSSPDEDPAFQAVVKKVAIVSKKQRAHATPDAKRAEAQAAAEAPKEEVTGRAQETKAGEMEAAPSPPFDAAGFKTRLFKRIAELAPSTMEEADDF
jgi:hypothetical protein